MSTKDPIQDAHRDQVDAEDSSTVSTEETSALLRDANPEPAFGPGVVSAVRYLPSATELRQAAERLESVYALLRPVYQPDDVCNALQHALDWRARDPVGLAAYCRGSVAHLDWHQLWPRWREWIQEGLKRYPRGD